MAEMRVPVCDTCPAPVLRRKGSRGPLPKRCDACRAPKPAAKKPAAARAPRTPARGEVGTALAAELAAMPERVQASTEAAAARALAVQVDQGLSMTAATRELTRVVALLRAMSPAERALDVRAEVAEQEVPTGVARFTARAAARRAAAAG
ncbi:hypothetical protein [Pseudonocardia broussonetiae]|uniref:Uncharacterized protein n=1 Tax=Pseudonocardia broussonetiae TaxID=2736640 RepID=A0A6M6JGP9_9PSEU|nr:hypothetical protein [Pseudonocardia broussonetiae]QJY46666.1 hypothetical protein HOP40_13255 [Pseudonocardia broussonetiae]